MNAIAEKIARSPKKRFFTLFIGSLVFSGYVGVYVNIVTPNRGDSFDWKFAFSGTHFVGLLVVAGIWTGINYLFLSADEDVARFADERHCVAFARKARLEAYARDLFTGKRGTSKSAAEVLKDLGLSP